MGFIGKMMAGTREYTVVDFACLKLALLALGILLGYYFADFFRPLTTLLWGVYLLTLAWVCYRTWINYRRQK